jgi:Uma2 family endonuclease
MIAEIVTKPIQKEKYWDENRIYTFDEYFELEEKAPFKSEFLNGKIRPMPNGTTNHAVICGSLFFYLKTAVKSSKINALAAFSELRIYIEPLDESTYPDCSITLGEPKYYLKDKAITNPTILFEVLSDSTGSYDRGEKFRKYKNLPSFREYVLIEQDQPAIDVLYKNEAGIWEMHSFVGLEDELQLRSIEVKIPLSDIYEDAKDLVLPQHKIDLEKPIE